MLKRPETPRTRPFASRAVSQVEIIPSYSAVWLKALAARRNALVEIELALRGLHLHEDRPIVGRIGHRDELVDSSPPRAPSPGRRYRVLDRVFHRDAGLGHGLREWIEVHHHQVDGRDAVLFHRLHVVGLVAPREDAAVDLRVQRLHAAFHHLRKAGVVGDLGHDDAVQLQKLRGAAGGQDLDAVGEQRLGELDDTSLVADRDVARVILDN